MLLMGSSDQYPIYFQTLIFNSTNICSFQQINALTSLRRLDNLTIQLDGNPVTKFTLWKSYVLFRLSHFALKKINDQEVSWFYIDFFDCTHKFTTTRQPDHTAGW